MLWQAVVAARDLGRLQQIAAILIRYGFGDMVRRLGLANALEKAGRVLRWGEAQELAHLETPARVRRALEEMGPTFIKLGQILATRVDLFDAEWIAEFSRLQDSAPTVPWAEIHAQLSVDLGAPPEEIFAAIDPQPLAAASVAQVHRARLEDGSEVIVKVRRPGIRPLIEADLRWLMRLAEFAESESTELRVFHPRDVVRQLTQSLRRELDFASECRSAERIAENFADFVDEEAPAQKVLAETHRAGETTQNDHGAQTAPLVVIPRVYWTWTGERVCVQEFIAGISGRKLADVDQAGLDRKVLARRGARAVLKMIVEDGFFHADPHPGNVFYLPGNRIAFIDFGMVGRLTEERRDQLIRLLLGLVKHEPRRVADVMLDWTGDSAMDEDSLLLEIQTFVQQYHGVALKQLRLGAMLSDLVAILRQHQLALPPDLSLLIKAFISLEGMGRELDPDFDMAGEAMPLLEQALRARYAPTALLQRGWRGVSEALSLVAGLPQDISRLLLAGAEPACIVDVKHYEIQHTVSLIASWMERSIHNIIDHVNDDKNAASLLVRKYINDPCYVVFDTCVSSISMT